MKLEDELKMTNFKNELQKAHLNIMFSASWLKTQVNQYLKNFHLSPEQYNVLRILRGQKGNPLCVKEITCRMLDRNSNTTRIIDKLEQKNLVIRQVSETDRRELRILITENGLNLLQELDEMVDFQYALFSNLTNEDAETLNRILDKMREKSS